VQYTTLSLPAIGAELAAIARDTQSAFGHLDERQLNWRPDTTRWSIAQCLDHLLNANREMFRGMDAAMDASRPRTVWQKMPILPRLFGSLMIKSQAPQAKRKFTAPRVIEPAASAIGRGIVERFVAQQHDAAARVRSFEGRDAAGTIMVSPFVAFITYSVLDGCRLIVAHEHRHVEQARRVTREPGFPST
jgi:hypothetical protein